jgi:hypothetical protein
VLAAIFVTVQIALSRSASVSCQCYGSLDNGLPQAASLARSILVLALTVTVFVSSIQESGNTDGSAILSAVFGGGIGAECVLGFWLIARLHAIRAYRLRILTDVSIKE